MDRIGISINSLFPIDITAALFSEVMQPRSKVPIIEIDRNLRNVRPRRKLSNNFVARLGIRSLTWHWANGWGLHHYFATEPSEMADAVYCLASSLAEAVETQIGEKQAREIVCRGTKIAMSIRDVKSRSDAIGVVLSSIFQKTTGRSPSITIFDGTIRSPLDWRFIRLVDMLRKAGIGCWEFVGGGQLVRWQPDITISYHRELFPRFQVDANGTVHLISDRALSIDDIFKNGWCIALHGPLKYLAVGARSVPHLPWYFHTDPCVQQHPEFRVLEYLSPPITPCVLRQHTVKRWIGPSGYSLIDYDHESCRALLSSLLNEPFGMSDLDYWQIFLTRLPVGSQRVMKNQRFIRGWIESEIHQVRQPGQWGSVIGPIEALPMTKLGAALIEHAAVIDYLCAVCWQGSSARYPTAKSIYGSRYFIDSSIVDTSWLLSQISLLLDRTFELLNTHGCPRSLYMDIKIATGTPRQLLRLGDTDMSKETHRKLRIARKAIAEVAKIYFSFMVFFLSTVLKADVLTLHLLLGADARSVFHRLADCRSEPYRSLVPVFWRK